MKTKINLLVLFLSIIPFVSFAQDYYYYRGKKIYLDIDKTKVNIWTYTDFDTASISNLNFHNPTLKDDNKTIDNENLKTTKLNFQTTPTEIEYYQSINALKNNPKIRNVSFFYSKNGSESCGTSNIFYVKLKNVTDYYLLEQVATQKNVDILHQLQFMPKWYKLGLKPKSLKTSIELSSEFYETGYFETIDPAFMLIFKHDIDYTPNSSQMGTANDSICNPPNDPHFPAQWNLKNDVFPHLDISACYAWELSKGDGIKIAVVDHGIDKTHEDLSANISPFSFNCETGTPPSVYVPGKYHNHGTQVSSVASAVTDNTKHIAGVAPKSQIISISHSFPPTSPPATISAQVALGINYAWVDVASGGAGADIINFSLNGNSFQSEVLEGAIENATTLGRDYKGCIFVKSAGNKGNNPSPLDSLTYPGNVKALKDLILTVGAMTPIGTRITSSSYKGYLDVMAPGEDIFTADSLNTSRMYNGTSLATPHVSGIAALMLAKNSCLSGRQVRDIIQTTCKKEGNYNYQNNEERPFDTWHEEMGYGLVDAYAAVMEAENMHSPTLDLYMKDFEYDLGYDDPEPAYPFTWGFDNSPDIWVRNQDDGYTNQEHENPEFVDENTPVYVYVRVGNKSCVTSNEGILRLYWTLASSGNSWPENWDGTYP